MKSFSGNWAHTLDPKGRVTIPSAYREALGERFTIGLNSEFTAVALYPQEKWDSMSELLKRIPDSDARGMRYVRLILGNSFDGCELDAQGRALIPASLRQRAGLVKGIRFVGMGQYLEVWDEDRFQSEQDMTEDKMPEVLDYVNDRYFANR